MTIYLLENEKEEWWILPTENQEIINANITLGIDITSYKGEIDESILEGYKTYEDAFKAYGYEKLYDEVDWEFIFNYKA